jgi:hypothetical protein
LAFGPAIIGVENSYLFSKRDCLEADVFMINGTLLVHAGDRHLSLVGGL